jgi:serine/threonine protein kinase
MKIKILSEQDATAPMKRVPKVNSAERSPVQILDARGYEIVYTLGQGEYGKVYAAYDEDSVEVAIKVMSSGGKGGQEAVDKEIRNYTAVQGAREESQLVAKHFPEVYETFQEGEFAFIVMEILSSGGAEGIEISDLFSGPEGLVDARKDLVARGAYKDFSRRLFAFFNDNDRRNSLVDSLFKGIDYQTADTDIKNMFIDVISQMKEVADLWRGPYDRMASEEGREEYRMQVVRLENAIIPSAHIGLVADFDTKKELTDNLWAYYIFLKMLERFKNQDEYMYEMFAGTIIENFMDLIRKGSPIPIHSRPERRLADRGGAPEEMAGISDQAKSLLAAIDEVERLTGLAPRDMHDKNAMIRPLGGDIVIVDLGLFKPRTEVKEIIKKNDDKKRESLSYRGDSSILETFRGATLEEGELVCEACLFEHLQEASCGCPDLMGETEYQGRKVELNKPMRGDVKKFKVYVKDPSTGNVKKVNFGDPNMRIRKSNPKARKSFRARHKCDNPGPKTKARYWSCKKW